MKMDLSIPAGLTGVMAGIAGSLDFGNQQLLRYLEGLTPEQLAAVPAGLTNSIATIVVHVCSAEIYFAHSLKGQPFPEELKARYLIGQEQDGRLPVATGETLESLKEKMQESRAILLETLAGLQEANLEEELPLGKERTATRRWFLALIPYHLASHIGQIQMIKKLIAQ